MRKIQQKETDEHVHTAGIISLLRHSIFWLIG